MGNFFFGGVLIAAIYWISKNPDPASVFEAVMVVLGLRITMLLTYATEKLDEIEVLLFEDEEDNDYDMINHPPYEIEGESDV